MTREPDHGHAHAHSHGDDDTQAHAHSHGLVDSSIVRSRAGLKAVAISLGILGTTAAIQLLIYLSSNSVALLADLVHNIGDAGTAIPLGIAFFLRSFRAERIAGLFVVAAIFLSACVAAYESIHRLIDPQDVHHLGALAAAGVVGFIGNELAARVRFRAGKALDSAALIADGNHARVDGYVSLGVIASSVAIAVGLPVLDPLIGLAITLTILKITRDSWNTVRHAQQRVVG